MSDYDTDILQWSERQAALLRRRAAGELVNDAEVDWSNIAEEIESVGRSERLALARHIETVIEHLAKIELSSVPEQRRSWRDTVLRARSAIKGLIEDTPSLLPMLDTVIAREMPTAVELAVASLTTHGETPLRPPEEISYTPEQVLGPWLPFPLARHSSTGDPAAPSRSRPELIPHPGTRSIAALRRRISSTTRASGTVASMTMPFFGTSSLV